MLERLSEFLAKNPKDTFVRYGYAMELSKLGRTDESVDVFLRLLADDPEYVPAYLQGALALMKAGRKQEAKEVFRKGMEVTSRKGDGHAYSELEGALGQAEQDY